MYGAEEPGEVGLKKVVLGGVHPKVVNSQLPGLPGLVERVSEKRFSFNTSLESIQESVIQRESSCMPQGIASPKSMVPDQLVEVQP
jgi:hypothetical protein